MKKITLLSCVLFLFIQLSFSQNETFSKRISIPNPSQSTLLKIKNAGIDLNCGPKFIGNNLEMELGYSDLVLLQENGIYYNILIDDLDKYYEERNAIELPKAKAELNQAKFLARQNKSKSDKVSSAKTLSLKNSIINNPAQHDDCDEIEWTEPANFQLGSMGGCLTVSEALAQLDLMRSLYPNLISVKTDASSTGQKTHGNSTGSTTWPGQTVYYVRISDNPDIDEPNEPETLITGMMHAREANSLMNVMYFMWYILENYNSDPYIKNIVDNQELYFIPITNPDGVRWNEVIAPSGGGLQRKNLGPSGYNSGTTTTSNNKRGVDLNRNFNYYWGWDDNGSSPLTNSDTFRGSSAGSEPETQIIKDFISNHNIKVAVNHHGGLNSIVTSSYNGYINAADSGREDEYAKICHDLTQYNRYIYGSAPNTLYEANGDVNDWMLGGPSVNSNGTISSGSGKNVLALTPENGDDFWPNPSLFVPIAKRAMRMNFIAVMHSGKFAKLHDLNKSNLTSTSGNLTFGVEYLGKTYGNITLTVTPVSSNITSMTSPTVQSGWTKLQQRNLSIPYTLNAGIQPNDEIEFQVTLSNDDFIIYRANFVKYYQPTILFQDNDVNTSNWTTSGGTWGTTTNAYVGSVAITDSPSGAYSNNENKTITLTNPINLSSSTQALVQFYAKWELERNFDLVQLEARRDAGSSWTPLCGKYNKPAATSATNYHLNKTTGTFQSTNVSIVYDGDSMDKWVMEEILINAADNSFLLGGTAVQFRFVFKTDSTNREDDLTTTFDGFSFDDFKVMSIQVPCVTSVPTGINASPITANAATINWDYIASATYDLRYRVVGSPTWIDVTGLTSPSNSITGLTPSTNYEVQIRSNCGTNNSAYSTIYNFSTTAITYCSSNGGSSTGGYIGNVTFGTINNTTGFGSGGYSNFTSISTNATKGSSYNISVTKAWPGTSYNDAIRVWIDYNKDGDFDDAGEQVLSSNPSKTTPITSNITIPATATSGATRMRVSLKYNATQTSCESFTYGEVEDYTINILPSCTKPADMVTNATICSGESYTWSVNSVVYTTSQSGLRISNDGCTADQVLNLTVTPKPADVVTNVTICSGESYTWAVNSVVYTTSQSGLRISNDGCTADQVLNLTVTPKPADVVTNATICSGESYTWAVNSVVYTTSQSGLRISNDGCTADQVLNLTVTPKPADVVTNATICSGESYTWSVNSVVYTTSQSGLRISNDGCTADQVLNLTVTPKPADVVTNATICSGESYTWAANSVVYTTSQSGLRISNDGCTADQVLNLTVTPKPADVVTNATICSGESYTWSANAVVYSTSQSGLRISNDGCTADQVLNLTVTPKPADIITNVTICSGESYTWAANAVVYSTSQSGLRISNDGCTADQVLNLTVTPKPADIITNVTICSGESYTWAANAVVYSTSQSGTRISNDGCTADQVLNLTVTPLNQYYVDADGDGYGSETIAMLCGTSAPIGYSINNLDCDDTNLNVNPGVSEIPGNGIDDDCNSSTLDGSLEIDDFNINNVDVLPNPFNNKITVRVPSSFNNIAFSIKIFDINGRLVFNKKHLSNNGIINVEELQNLEQAPYLVRITNTKTNNSILKRLIKY